jgi:uncharacterized protein YjbI with pentapeptide repeats
LRGAHLERASLNGAMMAEVHAGPMPIRGHSDWPTNLSLARLPSACLTNAELMHATLERADLTGADLRYADLTGACLREATLQGTRLEDAMLDEADLTDCTGVTYEASRATARGWRRE